MVKFEIFFSKSCRDVVSDRNGVNGFVSLTLKSQYIHTVGEPWFCAVTGFCLKGLYLSSLGVSLT